MYQTNFTTIARIRFTRHCLRTHALYGSETPFREARGKGWTAEESAVFVGTRHVKLTQSLGGATCQVYRAGGHGKKGGVFSFSVEAGLSKLPDPVSSDPVSYRIR